MIFKFIKWWLRELDNLCPHCGYYCTKKTIYCVPPKGDE